MAQQAMLDVLRTRGHVMECAVEVRACGAAGNGLFATRELAEGEVLLRVGVEAMITRATCEGVLAPAGGRRRRAGGEPPAQQNGSCAAASSSLIPDPSHPPSASSSSDDEDSSDDSDAAASSSGGSSSENALFCIYLMVQRGRGTDGYVAQLPQGNICHLDFASDRELALLQCDTRIAKVRRRRARLRGLYREIQRITATRLAQGDQQYITTASFLWAYGIIDSRAFSTKHSGYALIPFADLFNHAADGIHDFGCERVDGRDVFSFKAPRAMQEGDEVCLRYNAWMGGYQFAKHYGFIPEVHGAYDRYPLPHVGGGEGATTTENNADTEGRKETDREHDADRPEKKSEQLRRLAANLGINLDEPEEGMGGDDAEDGCTDAARHAARERLLEVNDCTAGGIQAGGLIEGDVIKRMRILSLGADFQGIERAVNGLFVSADNETCAYLKLLNVLRERLGGYTTTIGQDEAVLANHTLPPAARLCLMIRISDKKILTSAYHRTQTFLRAMAMSAYNGEAAPIAQTPIVRRPAHTCIDIDRVFHATAPHRAAPPHGGTQQP